METWRLEVCLYMDLNTAEKKAYFNFRSVLHNVVTRCSYCHKARQIVSSAFSFLIFFMGALSVKFDWMAFLEINFKMKTLSNRYKDILLNYLQSFRIYHFKSLLAGVFKAFSHLHFAIGVVISVKL